MKPAETMVNIGIILFVFGICCISRYGNNANPMEDINLFEGDMILESDQRWKIESGDVNPNIPLAATHSNLWPTTIAYDFQPEISNSSRAVSVIMQAIADYEKYTCLKFVRRTNEREYLNFYKGGGCSSHVGYYKYRVNSISLAGGCWYKGIVIHEIAHSLGFYHEQSRPDRDHYVKILWKNIRNGLQYNFKRHESNINSMNVPYDFLSVMHYGRTAFGSGRITIQTIDPKKQYKIGQRAGFSNLDILQMNLLYKCPGFTKPPTASLPPIPTTKPSPSTKNGIFLIRHVSGLCVSIAASGHLYLTDKCNDTFKMTSFKSLQHISTGYCVIPEKLSDGNYFKLTPDCAISDSRFEHTTGLSVKHLNSQKCIHPEGGRFNPSVDTKLVIYNGCDQKRLKFKFEYIPQNGQFIIKHYGSLCVALDDQNYRLILTNECNQKFVLTSNKNLQHVATGKCATPEALKDNSFIKLENNCNYNDSRFKQTETFSVKHLATGKCIHPLGGSRRPREGTNIVIYNGCDGNRLQFKFIYG